MSDRDPRSEARSGATNSGRVPSVEMRNVTKRFGDVVAVDKMSLRVESGEFLTLLGPSGCGKTTALRMIGGFELPSSGELLIHGERMDGRPPHRRPVNTVFQDYALFPHLDVGRNVAYGLERARVPYAERERRIGEALAMVRLPAVERRKPSELSGGQQQRVALARALINRPEVLLLDEPLGALDRNLRMAMQTELKRLNRETGATFIYVTHDQEEALAMSDRIAVMYRGRILQVGTPDEIYERPRHRFVAEFIGQSNILDGEVVVADRELVTVALTGSGEVRVEARAGVPATGRVVLGLRPERIMLVDDEPEVGPEWNRLEGRLESVTYLGSYVQLTIRPAGGQLLAVYRLNRSAGTRDLEIGELVTVAFRPSSVTILAV